MSAPAPLLLLALVPLAADNPPAKPPQRRTELPPIVLCRSGGSTYMEAWLYSASGRPENGLKFRNAAESCGYILKQLDLKPSWTPPAGWETAPGKKAAPAARVDLAIRHVLDDKPGTLAAQVESRYGADARKMFQWGAVLKIAYVVRDNPGLVSNDVIERLTTKYTRDAGLPPGLGLPILTELKADKPDLARGWSRADDRTDFYLKEVVTGKADVAVVNDPEFDTKLDQRKAADAVALCERRVDDAFRKAAGVDDKAAALARLLTDDQDKSGVYGRRLGELGPAALPGLCKVLTAASRPGADSRPLRAGAVAAVDMLLYQVPATQTGDWLPADAAAKWDGAGLPELITCLRTDDTRAGAVGVLTRLSLATGGKPVTGLRAERERAADGPARDGVDAALDAIAVGHAVRALAAVGPRTGGGPAAIADAAVVRQTGAAGRPAVQALGSGFDDPFTEGPVQSARRAVLEQAGILTPVPAELKAERARAVGIWNDAARKVDRRHPKYQPFETAIRNADIKISWLDEQMGGVVRRVEVGGITGLVAVVMQQNARAAGQFAAQIAMQRDLEKLVSAREFAVEMYRNLFDADVYRQLSPDDRGLLVKHGLLARSNPLRDAAGNR